MASQRFYVPNFELTSSFYVYNVYGSVTYSTPTTDSVWKEFATSGVPAGSTGLSAKVYYTITYNYYDGTQTPASGSAVNVTLGSNVGITFTHKAKTQGSTQSTKYVKATFSNVYVEVTYTPPTACAAPTSLTLSGTDVAPSKKVNLSWSGAKAGTNNPITNYKIYRATSVNGSYAEIGEKAESPFEVTAPAGNGDSYFYKIITIGTISGLNSGYSAASGALTCKFTAPSVSDVWLNNSANGLYVVAGSNVSLSWAGGVGTNNAISGYKIYRNGAFLQDASESPVNVPAHSSAGSSYYYSVQAIGALSNSGVVDGPTVYSYVACSAPTAISLASKDVGKAVTVRLSWSGAANGSVYNKITGYNVYLATSSGGTYDFLAAVSGTDTSGYLDVVSHATNGSSYYYKVLTVGERANSGQSSVYASLKTVWTLPVVSDVKIDGSDSGVYLPSGKAATLTWEGANGTNNNIQSYTVYLGGEVYASGLTAKTRAIAAHADAGSSYQYAVKAIGATEDGVAVNAPVLYTYGGVSAPSAVSLAAAIADAGMDVVLSWSGAVAGSYNDIAGYHIYRAMAENGEYAFLKEVLTSETSGSTPVTAHATMGSVYWYKVLTKGQRSNSALSSVKASLTAQTYSKPTAPSVVAIDVSPVYSGQSANLSWSGAAAGTNNAIAGYNIYRSTAPDSGYALLKYVEGSGTSGSESVEANPELGGKYYYKVETVGTKTGFIGSGMSSVYGTLSTYAYTYCGAATSISVSGGLLNPGDTVTVSWSGATPGTNNPIASYDVYRSVNGGTYAFLKNVLTASATDTVGASGTVYAYKVITKGEIAGYDSGFSGVASVKSNTAPTIPASVSASPALYESGNVAISFPTSTDVDGNLSKYVVQRRIEGAGGWGAWTDLNTNLTVLSMNDVPSVGRGYRVQYRVKAVDARGLESAYRDSGVVQRNRVPLAVSIAYPTNGKVTYNRRPYLKVSVSAEPDGQAQTIQYAVDSGSFTALQSVVSGAGVYVVRIHSELAYGLRTIKIRMVDSQGAVGGEVSVDVYVLDTAYARQIASGSVIADEMVSHQAEVLQLYAQVNGLRTYYGLNAISVPALVGNRVNVGAGNIGMFAAWGVQMKALQNAIQSTWALSGISPVSWIACTAGMYPRASVIAQIRNEIVRG